MTGAFTGLEVKNVSFSYQANTSDCVSDVSLNLQPGKFYGLIGPNGSGKSTFLDLLSGYLTPTNGTIHLNGKKISTFTKQELATLTSSVPQTFALNFDYTVEEVVLMGRYTHIPRFSTPRQIDFDMVTQAIESMGISHLKHRNVTHLSGGEKQRVMIARSLAQDTDLILLDEVTSNLDINHSIAIMKTMSKLVNTVNRTVVAALHDLNMASMFCDNLIVLKAGTVAGCGLVSDIISKDLIFDLYNVKSVVTTNDDGKKHIRFSYL